MAKAKKVEDIPGVAEKRTERQAVAGRTDSRKKALKNKKFEQLSVKQKDSLLKALGVAAGLIEDSDDE